MNSVLLLFPIFSHASGQPEQPHASYIKAYSAMDDPTSQDELFYNLLYK